MRLFFLALVFVGHWSFGQSISELKLALKSEDDSTRVAALGQLSADYRRSNPDSAFYFGRLALVEARKTGLRFGEASAHNAIGNIHFFQSSYDSTLYHYAQCLKISEELEDSSRMGAMYNNIGLVLTYQTKYDSSLTLLFKAREIREKVEESRLGGVLNNIGLCYQRMGDLDKAYEYFLEAAASKEKYDQELSLSNTLNNIGIVLKGLGRPKEAVPFYERSLEIAEKFNDKTKQANAHNNLAAIYQDDPDFHGHALDHYKMSVELKLEMGDKAGLFNSYAQLADLLSEMGQNAEALQYLTNAEKLNEELGQNLFTSIMYQVKSDVLWRIGRKDEAFEALKESNRLKAEEMTTDRNEKIAELEAKFEKAQNQAEIERLSLEGELKDANLTRSRNTQLAIGVGSFITIIALLFSLYQRNKKNKLELEAQELQVEALTKRLIDLNATPSDVEVNFKDLNKKLNTPLTEREFEALMLSLDGKSNSEIGEALFISTSTVKFHLRNTYGKLGVNNRKEALDYVVKTS